jgi:ATP-dependent Lhr-like helicase
VVQVTRDPKREPRVAMYIGAKLPTSVQLSHRVAAMLADRSAWAALPPYMRAWLATQDRVSRMPSPDRLLVETFPRGERHHLAVYGFAGRNAHQTLGFLVTRRMEDAGLDPLGFVADDYALLIWGLAPVPDPRALLTPEGLRDGLDTWLAENVMMKRTFRNVAVVAGLIERNFPGLRKTGRQATFSSDILYDTLRKYDPDHLLLRITRDEAGRGLVDFDRVEEMLARVAGRIDLVRAPRVTPLAAPLMLDSAASPSAAAGRRRGWSPRPPSAARGGGPR